MPQIYEYRVMNRPYDPPHHRTSRQGVILLSGDASTSNFPMVPITDLRYLSLRCPDVVFHNSNVAELHTTVRYVKTVSGFWSDIDPIVVEKIYAEIPNVGMIPFKVRYHSLRGTESFIIYENIAHLNARIQNKDMYYGIPALQIIQNYMYTLGLKDDFAMGVHAACDLLRYPFSMTSRDIYSPGYLISNAQFVARKLSMIPLGPNSQYRADTELSLLINEILSMNTIPGCDCFTRTDVVRGFVSPESVYRWLSPAIFDTSPGMVVNPTTPYVVFNPIFFNDAAKEIERTPLTDFSAHGRFECFSDHPHITIKEAVYRFAPWCGCHTDKLDFTTLFMLLKGAYCSFFKQYELDYPLQIYVIKGHDEYALAFFINERTGDGFSVILDFIDLSLCSYGYCTDTTAVTVADNAMWM